jgi:hypothetical protein
MAPGLEVIEGGVGGKMASWGSKNESEEVARVKHDTGEELEEEEEEIWRW